MKIIGIAGFARSGKDTAAEYISDRYGFIHMKFADALKRGVHEIFNLTTDEIAVKEQVVPYWEKSPREMYQWVGTELFRNHMAEFLPGLEKNFWIASLMKRVKNLELATGAKEIHIVISDVRFPNEIDLCAKHGIVIHMQRAIARGNVGIAGHSSEDQNAILTCPQEKLYALENDGSIAGLESGIDYILSSAKYI